jgi:hypothetical protein
MQHLHLICFSINTPQQAVYPFAMDNVSSSLHRAAFYLGIGYQLGAAFMLLGDLSTTRFVIPLFLACPIYSLCVGVIYLALLPPGIRSSGAPLFLVFLFTTARFLESHILTSCYRWVATELKEHREAASRAVGVADQVL